MSYKWRIASSDDFHSIYALIYNSKDCTRWDLEHIKRRVLIPLFLEQLIVFENAHKKLCAFLTYALMDGQSACHQSTIGILQSDWRSGKQLWIVDFFSPFGDATKMIMKLRSDVFEVVKEPLRYFRLKRKSVKRINFDGELS